MASLNPLIASLNTLAAILAVAVVLALVPYAFRWAGKLLRVLGALSGLGMVAVTLLAAIVLFERR